MIHLAATNDNGYGNGNGDDNVDELGATVVRLRLSAVASSIEQSLFRQTDGPASNSLEVYSLSSQYNPATLCLTPPHQPDTTLSWKQSYA